MMRKLLLALLTLTLCPASIAQVYPFFPPPGMTYNGTNWGPLSSMPAVAADTILANITNSSAAPVANNPLAVANLMAATLGVDVVSTSNITLSGTQGIDGISVGGGQTVLVTAQSTPSQNGIYVSSSGAWTRAVNFPAGFVISQNCDLNVVVREGTAHSGSIYFLRTNAGTTTIGTSSQSWTQNVPFPATTTARGAVTVTAAGLPSAVFNAAAGNPAASNDCVNFADANGSIGNLGDASGNLGTCAVESVTTGHLTLTNTFAGGAPVASAGTINTHSTDHWGIVTGLSGATTLTITFSNSYTNPPGCTANTSQAATPVTVSTTATVATFTFSSLTGSVSYVCFGTN